MKRTEWNGKCVLFMLLLLMLQVIAAFCFCGQKTGYHYDEYYSYYSSNVSSGLGPWNQDWKTGEDIFNEFAVLNGERFNFAKVVEMQSYDVHPPVYYLFLHALCSLIPGVFTKWTGLALNLLFFAAGFGTLAWLAWHVGGRRREIVFASCLLYGFCPAVISGIMLVRMYTMLGFWILLITCLHVRALEYRKRGLKFYLALAAVTILGFLTHYYFAVYLFFLAAAMECCLLFDSSENKKTAGRLKECVIYGAVTVSAMLTAVALYPASASHIFRGYRGTEAMGAFFDIENTLDRLSFFAGLLNTYAFGSVLPVFGLLLLLLAVTLMWLSGRSNEKIQWKQQKVRLVVGTAALGYFAVVTKTALLTAEEANRYQIPVYGLLLMLSVTVLWLLAEKVYKLFCSNIGMICGKNYRIAFWAMVLAVSIGQIWGLCSGKVLFLYRDDAAVIAEAEKNTDTTVIYFYSDAQKWMTWDDSLELMQYEDIYFVSLSDAAALTEEAFADERIAGADRLLVYCMRHDNTPAALEVLLNGCDNLNDCRKIRELLYCDLYELTY